MWQRTFKRLLIIALAICPPFIWAATTKINLSWQAVGILPIANAGSGTATTSARYIMAGPLYGSAAAYGFLPESLVLPNLLIPSQRRFTYNACAINSGNGMTIFGDGYNRSNSGGYNVATATLPVYCVATSGNPGAGTQEGSLKPYIFGKNIRMQAYTDIAMANANTDRHWLGIASIFETGTSTWSTSDGPQADYAMFRYNTNIPDANLKCVTNDNSVAPAVVASSVTPTAGFHKYEIFEDVDNSKIYFVYDGSLACTATSQLPTAGVAAGWTSTWNSTAGIINGNLAWFYVETDF